MLSISKKLSKRKGGNFYVEKSTKGILVIIAVLLIASLSILGYRMLNQKETCPTSNSEQYANIPKHKLSIFAEFMEIGPVSYTYQDAPYIDFEITLTDLGQTYMATELFNEKYDMEVMIINNDTKEEYVSLYDLEWNVSDQQEYHLKLPLEEAKRKEFEQQLDKVDKEDEYLLYYTIQLTSKGTDDYILRTVGFIVKALS